MSKNAIAQGTSSASHVASAPAATSEPDLLTGSIESTHTPWPPILARRPAAEILVLTCLALAVALAVPYEVAVFGVLIIGVPHVALELRYVCGRYHGRLPVAMFVALQVGLVLIALTRLLAGSSGRVAELSAIVLLSALAVVVVARQQSPVRFGPALVVLALGSLLVFWAITHIDTWFVVQAHLHNLLPLVFLWAWAATLPEQRRRTTRAACVAFAVAVPLVLLLTPLGDSGGDAHAATTAVTPLAPVTGAVTPPAFSGGQLAPRLLVVFAFAQLMHYAVWCWFLPRRAPSAMQAFDATSVGRALAGARFWLLVAGVTTLVAVLALVEYKQGRTLYSSIGAYHAYLEYPIIAVLALGWLAEKGSRHAT